MSKFGFTGSISTMPGPFGLSRDWIGVHVGVGLVNVGFISDVRNWGLQAQSLQQLVHLGEVGAQKAGIRRA